MYLYITHDTEQSRDRRRDQTHREHSSESETDRERERGERGTGRELKKQNMEKAKDSRSIIDFYIAVRKKRQLHKTLTIFL